MFENKIEKNLIIEGSLYKIFILYLLPIFLGSLIQQSYTFLDALIIGNFAGKGSLAAIDAPYAYIKLLINAFIALSTGGTIMVSQYYGAREKKKLENIISNLIRISVIGGFVITILGYLLAPTFIKIMNIPADIYKLSLSYLRVYFLGSVFVFTYNIASGILRALGDSKSPFYFLMAGSIINVFFDLLFVGYFKMSVVGAALGSLIGQAISMALLLWKLKKLGYSFGKTNELDSLKETIKLGYPLAVQSILFSISNMFMQMGINSFGTDSIAGWSICGKSDFIIWSLADTMGIAVTTFVAQNYGAQKEHRMRQSVRCGLLMSTLTIGLISLILFVFIGPIGKLFTRDTTVIQSAVVLMKLTSPFYILYAFGEVFAGGIKGRGNTLSPMIISFIGSGLFRIAWVQLVSRKYMSLNNIILGYPWSWAITALLFGTVYIIIVYRKQDQSRQEEDLI